MNMESPQVKEAILTALELSWDQMQAEKEAGTVTDPAYEQFLLQELSTRNVDVKAQESTFQEQLSRSGRTVQEAAETEGNLARAADTAVMAQSAASLTKSVVLFAVGVGVVGLLLFVSLVIRTLAKRRILVL